MTKLEELKDQSREAAAAYYAMEKERNAYKREREQKLAKELEAEIEATFPELKGLYAKKNVAERAIEAEQNRLAKEEPSPAFPIGMRVEKWEKEYHFSPLKKTAEGVIEIWTSDALRPANKSWGFPNIGDTIVRILKKDGTPSAKFERLRTFLVKDEDGPQLPWGWREAGKHPSQLQPVTA